MSMLKDEIAKDQYKGMAPDQIAALINSQTVQGPKKDILLTELIGYLAGVLKLPALAVYAEGDISQPPVAAAKTLFLMPGFGVTKLVTSDPTQYGLVQQLLGLIVADKTSGMAQADADAIIALADNPIALNKALGFDRPVDYGDIKTAMAS